MPFDQVQNTQDAAAPETDNQQKQSEAFQKFHQPFLNVLKSIGVSSGQSAPALPSCCLQRPPVRWSCPMAPRRSRANRAPCRPRNQTAQSGCLRGLTVLHRSQSSSEDPDSARHGTTPSSEHSAASWIAWLALGVTPWARTLEAFQQPDLIL